MSELVPEKTTRERKEFTVWLLKPFKFRESDDITYVLTKLDHENKQVTLHGYHATGSFDVVLTKHKERIAAPDGYGYGVHSLNANDNVVFREWIGFDGYGGKT